VRILQEIRDEQRATRTELGARFDAVGSSVENLAEESRATRHEFAQRFHIIETALRDMAEQLVMLGKGRVAELEKSRDPH
jgi:hypothetical protein